MTETALETMIPFIKTVAVKGEQIEIRPIKVKNLSAVMKIVADLMPLLGNKTDRANIIQVAMSHSDKVSDLVGVCIDKKADWIGDLEIDQLINLFTAVLEVNLDFFTQRVFPSVLQAMAVISERNKGQPKPPKV